YAMQRFLTQLKVPFNDLLGLGRVKPADEREPFCMTVLALKLSRAPTAASALKGAATRKMWQALYPGVKQDDVPTGHITNGIHLLGWMKGSARQFWREKMKDKREGVVKMWDEKYGHDWASAIHHPE